jgi:hypothetical protein
MPNPGKSVMRESMVAADKDARDDALDRKSAIAKVPTSLNRLKASTHHVAKIISHPG